MSEPIFSVVIALPDHRGEAVASIHSLACQQIHPRSDYEVIVASDGAEPTLEADVRRCLADGDSLIVRPAASLLALFDAGARHARGRLLFFTESHCIAEPECLEALADYFATHDVEAAGCTSDALPGNRFSDMEQRLYEEDLHERSQDGQWKKVTIRGFAVRRDIYLELGGLEPRYGHFAEPVLGAKLAERGCRVGFVPGAIVHHRNKDSSQDLSPSLVEYGIDECRYRLEAPSEFRDRYFGWLHDWSEREAWRPASGRLAFGVAARSLASGVLRGAPMGMQRALLRALVDHGLIAMLGARALLLKTRLQLLGAQLRMKVWRWSRERYYRAYRDHWRGRIHYGHARFTARHLRTPAPARTETTYYDVARPDDPRLTGFLAPDESAGKRFRWSRPLATVQISLCPGTWDGWIETVPVRPAGVPARLSLYLDGRRIPLPAGALQEAGISFRITPSMFRGSSTNHHLSLVCNPFGRSALGLPVAAIHFSQAGVP